MIWFCIILKTSVFVGKERLNFDFLSISKYIFMIFSLNKLKFLYRQSKILHLNHLFNYRLVFFLPSFNKLWTRNRLCLGLPVRSYIGSFYPERIKRFKTNEIVKSYNVNRVFNYCSVTAPSCVSDLFHLPFSFDETKLFHEIFTKNSNPDD